MYNLMRYGVEYPKKSEEEYAEQQRDRQERQLYRRARELGYKLEKMEKPAPAKVAATESEAK